MSVWTTMADAITDVLMKMEGSVLWWFNSSLVMFRIDPLQK